MKHQYKVWMVFFVLTLFGVMLSGLSFTFVANGMINRFIRNGVMVLALIIPIRAGLGLNFSITVGAMCAQIGYITALAFDVTSIYGHLLVLVISVTCALMLGRLIGIALNRVRGKEMITTMIIGFLANGIYQLVFLVCVGKIIPVKNREIILSRGIGVRNMVDLKIFKSLLDDLSVLTIGRIELPIVMFLLVFCFGGIIYYILHTPFGQKVKCVGDSVDKSHLVGINSNKIRVQAMVISTVMATFGHLIYLQNIGMLNVYTGHLKHEIFASAALLAGGATIKEATVKQAFIGLFLFHGLFIVSPQAGQALFNNPALGEYFRSFVAYGTIAFALVINNGDKAHLSIK